MTAKRLAKRPLTIREILSWADAYREVAGRWPTVKAGRIRQAPFESWIKVDMALRLGLRDLPGGSSLAQLLAEHRGARNPQAPSLLTVDQILHWADEYYRRTGAWPTSQSGPIPGSDGEKWKGIDRALRMGIRHLPGGSSLARVLAEHRGRYLRTQLPMLREEQILQWADAHRERTGRWPSRAAGPIPAAPGETWAGIDRALREGSRGLHRGSSLALFLAERRGARNAWTRPNLAIAQILAWADAFHERTGGWPQTQSGPILEAPEETWRAVNLALFKGGRGLGGGSTLAQLLAAERGVRNRLDLPRFTRKQILAWADAHHRRTGAWPTRHAGPVVEAPEETWLGIDDDLRDGCRGLRSGSSLARLLAKDRGVTNPADRPRLSKKKIVAWADAHYQRTGQWPTAQLGPVHDAPAEKWYLIDRALRKGLRGLTGGSSLTRLLIAKGRLPQTSPA
jgi:hypothetical protein